MGLSNRLCNPTPFKQIFHYGAGTQITIEPLSSIELHYSQMSDFVPTKAGWPAVKEDLDFKGLFVLDPDRPYDNQALEAIQRSKVLKQERYRSAREEMRNSIARQGLQYSEDALNERLERGGFNRILREAEELAQQEEYYAKIVKAEEAKASKKHSYDPKRTIFVMDPPREFPSEGAMQYFLNRPENKAVKDKHEEFINKMAATVAKQEKKEKTTNV